MVEIHQELNVSTLSMSTLKDSQLSLMEVVQRNDIQRFSRHLSHWNFQSRSGTGNLHRLDWTRPGLLGIRRSFGTSCETHHQLQWILQFNKLLQPFGTSVHVRHLSRFVWTSKLWASFTDECIGRFISANPSNLLSLSSRQSGFARRRLGMVGVWCGLLT